MQAASPEAQKRTASSEAVLPVSFQIVLKNGSAVCLAHSLLELIDTSACIYELLLTCVERVALGADVNTQAALRGSCLESLAASALYGDNLCLRMDSFFHVFHLLIKGQARNSKTHVCLTGLYVLGNVTTGRPCRQDIFLSKSTFRAKKVLTNLPLQFTISLALKSRRLSSVGRAADL